MRSDQEILQIFESFEQNDSQPQTELIYSTNFSFLVAVMLSAQATDKSVNKVMGPHLRDLESPNAILAHDEQYLANLIKSINFYKTKAHNIYEMSQIISNDISGEVPLAFDSLIKLPGVGGKTARVVLNVLADTGDIGVDTHVFRISHRLGLSDAATKEKLNEDLYKVVPQNFWNRVNHWFVLHGRYICSARAPKCDQCHIRNLCHWK
ncbi:MAG: endonuclease III [Holosporales bacterium]|jgi:endonuclease-3|nr:endonuclease III [Holosporales bacterium]